MDSKADQEFVTGMSEQPGGRTSMSRLAGDWVRRGWEGRWVWDTGEESLRPAEDEGPLRTQRETVWSPGKGGRTYLGGV